MGLGTPCGVETMYSSDIRFGYAFGVWGFGEWGWGGKKEGVTFGGIAR